MSNLYDEIESNDDKEEMEPTITNVNYDRDDSLNDVISFGKQTPFRFDYGNNDNKLTDELDDPENLGVINTTIDLIDNSSNDLILNLKDTIDEIYLIPESIKKKFLFKSTEEEDLTNEALNSDTNLTGLIEADTSTALNKQSLIYQTPPASSRHRLSLSGSRIKSSAQKDVSNNNSIIFKSDSKLNSLTTSPSRIPVSKTPKNPTRPQSRLSFTNYDPPKPNSKLFSSTNQITKQVNTSTRSKSTNIKPKTSSKNDGAFKYYSTSSKPTEKSCASPFVVIDKKKAVKKVDDDKSTKSRPSTVNLNYSIDSDESILLENLINNPDELKKKLKEGKMNKEQLGQLQQNYIHLLEQYAEKENFIDKFRLGYDWNLPSNNKHNSQVSNQTPSPKFSNNIDTSQAKLNVSNEALKVVDSATDTYGSFNPKSFTPNNEIILLNSNANQQGVFVITTSNTANRDSSNLITPVFGHEDQAASKSDINPEENIVFEQNSKLGILLQTKLLEDKMQSFVTLVNEKQLNQLEQKQVFESIKTDYETLLKNYQEVKKNDISGVLPNELDMDIDLNKELDKMKDLLNNIVDKMSMNQAEKLASGSVASEENKSPRGSSINTSSSYGNNNNDELMDQYNRLLDVFNTESNTKPKSVVTKSNEQESRNLSATLLSSSSQSQSSSPNKQLQAQNISSSSNKTRNKAAPTETNHTIKSIKNTGRSPKRTKQQLTPSDTSSESNNGAKKFIQNKQTDILLTSYNPSKKQVKYNNNNKNEQVLKRNVKLQQEEDLDYDDIIEVESDLLDNSFINENVQEEVIDYNQFEENIKQYQKTEQIYTESEYENFTNMIRTSSLSHYKSSSSSSVCLKPQIFNVQKTNKPINNKDKRIVNPQQIEPTKMNNRQQKATPHKKEWEYSSRLNSYDEETEQDKTVLYINDDHHRKHPVKHSSKQQMNFNPSSSSSSNSMLSKPRMSAQQLTNTNSNRSCDNGTKLAKKSVAKAYEGSESDEFLETLDHFERNYESVSVKMVNNEANKRHNHHHYQQQHEHHLSEKSRPVLRNNDKKKQYSSNRRYSSHETCDETTHRQIQHAKLVRTELKSETLSEFSHSTEVTSSTADLNKKTKSKNTNKAVLMKQLADEVESLKQQILKKHLTKMRDTTANDEKKKIKKSQSYQNYQSLKEEETSTDKPKVKSNKYESSKDIRHYNHTDEKKRIDEKQIASLTNSKQIKNDKRSYIASDETSSSTASLQIQQMNVPIQATNQFYPDNLLCYDSQGRFVTILPKNINPYCPLNEIHPNIIQPNIQPKLTKPLNAFNHMQTQTQIEPVYIPQTIVPQTSIPQKAQFYTQTPVYQQQPVAFVQNANNPVNTSNNHSKRRIRYYIREYGDTSPASDNEATFNRFT